MHVQLPNNITDLSITFFAGGRPHEIQRSHKNFELVRTQVLDWNKGERSEADVTALVNLADPKQELLVASGGRLEFAGNQIMYGGVALHNLWVDKIIGFKDAGEDFGPIFLALEDLQKNPTPAARDRLPIFVERSKLGFLPDGRIAAFKGVREDFYDVHSGTVHYGIGKTVAMDRAACNANPDQTCTTGLHLGAIDYINNNGFGWNGGSNRRMLLTAFWPRHVVAVPTDYAGGKMRVEQLTVLDEVDKGYVTELLAKGTLMIRGYEIETPAATETSAEPKAATTDATTPAGKAKVGDWVEISGDDNLEEGEYFVTHVDEVDNDGQRLSVKTGNADDDYEDVNDDSVDSILTEAPTWARAKVGDWVTTNDDRPLLVIEVDDKDNYPDGSRLKLRNFESEDWAENNEINEVLASPPDVWLRVIEDDLVTIEGHALFRDGEYNVISVDSYADTDATGELYEISAGDSEWTIRNDLIKSIKREVEEAAALGAAAATAAAVLTPAFERAKVGDTIRVLKGTDHEAGDFEVTQVLDGDTTGRLAVKYRSYSSWWISNDKVVEIVTADAAPAAPVVPAEPAWKRAKVGDTVRIEGSGRFTKSTYVVDQIDAGNGMGRRLRLDNPGGAKWVDNIYVKDIVMPVALAAAPAVDTRPLWEQVLAGDKVRIEGDPDVSDGEYIVKLTDGSLTNGPDSVGVRLEYDGYVYNKTVKAILERDGKPFGVSTTVTADPIDTRPAYLRAKVGDTVVVEGASNASDGKYEVVTVDEGDSLRLKVRLPSGGTTWIINSRIKDVVVPVSAPVELTGPDAYKQAKVGDMVEVGTGHDHRAGIFKVTTLNPTASSGMRLGVDYDGRNSGIWWIYNNKVTKVIPAVAQAA